VVPPRWIHNSPVNAEDAAATCLFRSGDIVVFQKVTGDNTLSLMSYLRAQGVTSVYIDCDLPVKGEAALASHVVCSSGFLAEEYRGAGIGPVSYIPDAYEVSRAPRPERPLGDTLRCVWFGSATPEK
jgi:hypothetical protein